MSLFQETCSWEFPVVQQLGAGAFTAGAWVQSLSREDLLEKEMATHINIFDWEIPWTEEPDRVQFIGLQRVGHDLATKQ